MSKTKTTTQSRQIGPYRVTGSIGQGGMGAVYKAYDTRLERFVALKRMHRTEERDQARLRREARAIAQLSHPNIVQVFDLRQHGEDDWIVMELVGGMSLRAMVQRQPLDMETLIRVGLDVTRGLAAAHARGIVHSDLKTDNVIVTSTGRAKILDFGLAQLGPGTKVAGSMSGRIQGTPRSMSPEQAFGERSTFRSDLFSLGVLLYECVLGRSPFEGHGKGLLKTLTAVCTHEPTPLAEICDQVPQELSLLVSKLLQKDPKLRPEGAEEVLVDLKRIESRPSSDTVKVLFVDDEPDIQPLIRQWFDHKIRAGRLQLSFAGDGVAALEALRTDPSIQMVFTDLNMPNMNGLTLIRELKALERPIVSVVLSAYGDISNIRAAMHLGAFDFLTKPIDLEDLERTLEKASEHLRQMQEAERLRAENQLLGQRNRHIRDAWNRYLQGDPSHQELIGPMIEEAVGNIYECSFLVTLEITGFDDLPRSLTAGDVLELSQELCSRTVQAARRHKGFLLSMDGGRFVVGFGLGQARRLDARRAGHYAADMRSIVEVLSRRSVSLGGPALESMVSVDSLDTNLLPADLPDVAPDSLDGESLSMDASPVAPEFLDDAAAPPPSAEIEVVLDTSTPSAVPAGRLTMSSLDDLTVETPNPSPLLQLVFQKDAQAQGSETDTERDQAGRPQTHGLGSKVHDIETLGAASLARKLSGRPVKRWSPAL